MERGKSRSRSVAGDVKRVMRSLGKIGFPRSLDARVTHIRKTGDTLMEVMDNITVVD